MAVSFVYVLNCQELQELQEFFASKATKVERQTIL
jgi:hypothetical protein